MLRLDKSYCMESDFFFFVSLFLEVELFVRYSYVNGKLKSVTHTHIMENLLYRVVH